MANERERLLDSQIAKLQKIQNIMRFYQVYLKYARNSTLPPLIEMHLLIEKPTSACIEAILDEHMISTDLSELPFFQIDACLSDINSSLQKC